MPLLPFGRAAWLVVGVQEQSLAERAAAVLLGEQAPDTILVDAEVVAVIEEQQRWVREQFPGLAPGHLFSRRSANACGAKPYARQSYIRLLQHFSESAQITDSAGKPVHLNHTHRFRHTRLTGSPNSAIALTRLGTVCSLVAHWGRLTFGRGSSPHIDVGA